MRPLLEIKNVRKTYGRQVVLDDVSFVVIEGQKIALIGRNGAGKSTLLKIAIGDEEADGIEGIKILPWTRVGIVKQHDILPADETTEMYLERISGKPQWTVRKEAAKFGLTMPYLSVPPATLSGGYQMRVKLVAMFLQEPNLLLLDEPVNYLDLNTLLLLERVLVDYKGSFIMTAHDREFLQNTCTQTFEIEDGKLISYSGSVEEYSEWKGEQEEFRRQTNKRLAREIKHTQEFVDRFRYKASLASQAQSKLKHIARLRTQLNTLKGASATTRIIIPTPHFIPGTALRTEKLSIGYGDRVIASDITMNFNRGEKIVIVGENGRGKSTLLKTFAGKIQPLGGKMAWWHKADIGYYDQKTDATLLFGETVLEYLTRHAPHDAPAERILMMAGNFLFRNDDLEKTTNVLSGGERARLCLAGILLREHNVLILDEPTNHLDVQTTEALAEALKEYGGTVVFVSHARTFVNALADKIYEVRDGRVRHFVGTYEEYVNELASEIVVEDADDRGVMNPDAQAKAERRLRVKEVKRELEKLDALIKALDKEKSEILKYFFENPTDYAPEKSRRLKELEAEMEIREKKWFVLQGELEAFLV